MCTYLKGSKGFFRVLLPALRTLIYYLGIAENNYFYSHHVGCATSTLHYQNAGWRTISRHFFFHQLLNNLPGLTVCYDRHIGNASTSVAILAQSFLQLNVLR
jgi:hypothetical protein